MEKSSSIYNVEISAGSLLQRESREIARLLLDDADKEMWYRALVVDNVLQKSSPTSARRMARLIRNRLEAMSPEFWDLVSEGNMEVGTQALLAASIKHSKLLGDFINEVVRMHYRTYKSHITANDWKNFFEECEQRDSGLAERSETTKKKMAQVVFRILAEAKIIDDTKSMKLLPFQVVPEVRNYLLAHGEDEILRCMEFAS